MDIEQLKNRDYYLLLDKSGSMEEHDCNGKSRWEAARESTIAIASKIAEYDPDGITVLPFAGSYKLYDNTNADTVKNIFNENSPMGGTNLAPPLKDVFNTFLKQKDKGETKSNGALVIVVTDGCPQDEHEVAHSIVNFTKKLSNREEFGISFIQVGRDSHAADYLRRLDSGLQKEGAKLDIVNCKTMDELENVGLTEALFSALSE